MAVGNVGSSSLKVRARPRTLGRRMGEKCSDQVSESFSALRYERKPQEIMQLHRYSPAYLGNVFVCVLSLQAMHFLGIPTTRGMTCPENTLGALSFEEVSRDSLNYLPERNTHCLSREEGGGRFVSV